MQSAAQYQIWPDEKLLELIRFDDRTAFELLYNRYSSKVFHVAYNLFRDKTVCEDLVQELFIDLWFKRYQLKIDNLSAYLKVAIKNRVIVYLRTQKATLDIDTVDKLIEQYTADSKLMQNDILKLLEANIAALPEKCRQIFILSRKEYLSNKEIAARLNLSVKTVENQITIALRHIRTGLTDYLPAATLFVLLNQHLN
ncbi:RNA polymerase sigma-70 factor [Mucilaginibacter limnophilus]|uniref:RNA polymerase sigma-70 factor n=1 Tax=Mucilaginibacter limnophilus TaxID=1932778 RepID=A0A437MZD0_9SPHI|nr:RNA polymerase sigma-70 factor [Mucilaginibacter limnophilus]RVU03025.1 RNA polymerase sigma-70 factor [Mucilaginibacter limnophilus]